MSAADWIGGRSGSYTESDLSRHEYDDKKREEEQELFLDAFELSIIPDKRIVWVTGPDGHFRSKEEILEEAIE